MTFFIAMYLFTGVWFYACRDIVTCNEPASKELILKKFAIGFGWPFYVLWFLFVVLPLRFYKYWSSIPDEMEKK